MCTVTVIPLQNQKTGDAAGYRLACNRDELRERAEAHPPGEFRFGNRLATYPVDPVSGGTWVALNDAGLALALLNVNPVTRVCELPDGFCVDTAIPVFADDRVITGSRGSIIPSLLHHTHALDAAHQAADMDPRGQMPFHLVCVDKRMIADVRCDGVSFIFSQRPLNTGPVMFTSSGLGDSLVDSPRRKLFKDLFEYEFDASTQDTFHHHRWPDQGHLSVCMTRLDARTVSHTVIEAANEEFRLTYQPCPPEDASSVTACYRGA